MPKRLVRPESPLLEEPKSWEALAVLAVMEAAFDVMSPAKKRRFADRLEEIAKDWARPDAAPDLQYTAGRFLRPATRLIRPPLGG